MKVRDQIYTKFLFFKNEIIDQVKNFGQLCLGNGTVKANDHFDHVSSGKANQIEVSGEKYLVLALLKELVQPVLDIIAALALTQVEQTVIANRFGHLVQNQLIGCIARIFLLPVILGLRLR